LNEKIRYLSLCLILLPVIISADEIEARLKIADSLFYAEKFPQAESLYKEVLKSVRGLDKGLCLKGLGNIALYFGDLNTALNYYNQALAIFQENRFYPGETKVYLNFGSVAFYQGNLVEAEEYYRSALDTSKKIEDKTTEDKIDEINIQLMLGRVSLSKNDYQKAKAELHSALENSQIIDYKKGIIDGAYFLGSLFVQSAETDSALKYFEQSCSLSLNLGLYKSAYDGYRELGNIKRKLGEYNLAYEYLFRALSLVDRIRVEKEFVLGEGELLNNIGSLYLDLGRFRLALEKFLTAYGTFEKIGNIPGKIEVLQNIGYTYLLLSPVDFQYFDSALYYYNLTKPLIKNKKDEAIYYNNLGIFYEKKGEYKIARNNYKRAFNIYKISDDRIGMAKTLCNLGNLAVLVGDYKDGIKRYKDGYNIIEDMKRLDWQASILLNLGFAQKRLVLLMRH